ncbi:hypothetical protein, partial [Nostoc sp. UHCC 0252]|uniref:hypothetical protein n=1 Tax=Nostoc sp. UHCC 0252 TaxID=3110241 RepID=UPI002B2145F5
EKIRGEDGVANAVEAFHRPEGFDWVRNSSADQRTTTAVFGESRVGTGCASGCMQQSLLNSFTFKYFSPQFKFWTITPKGNEPIKKFSS